MSNLLAIYHPALATSTLFLSPGILVLKFNQVSRFGQQGN
jgi:hypothetical protein